MAYLRLVTHCNLPRTPRLRQAMLKDKIEKLQATVAQQQKQIEKQRKQMEIFTAQLKEQAVQSEKGSAQLEMNHRPSQMVVNNH